MSRGLLVKFCGSVLFAVLCTNLHGQSEDRVFRVINKESNQPIPYVNVSIHGTLKGTYSDENGYATVRVSATDTLLISAIGFESLKLNAFTIKGEVALKQAIVELDPIVVRSKRMKGVQSTIGYSKAKKVGIYSGYKTAALQIDNARGRSGKVSFVYYVVGHGAEFKSTNYKVRVRIYDVVNNQPGRDLLAEDLTQDIIRNQRNIVLDVRPFEIPFPKEGVFVALEFLGYYDEGDRFVPFDNSVDLSGAYHFSPAFSSGHSEMRSWISGGSEWRPVNMSPGGNGFANFNFGIKVEY